MRNFLTILFISLSVSLTGCIGSDKPRKPLNGKERKELERLIPDAEIRAGIIRAIRKLGGSERDLLADVADVNSGVAVVDSSCPCPASKPAKEK